MFLLCKTKWDIVTINVSQLCKTKWEMSYSAIISIIYQRYMYQILPVSQQFITHILAKSFI